MPQPDGILFALVTTTCAHHAVQGQAIQTDFEMDLPGWQSGLIVENARLADLGTGVTEGTFTAVEIDFGIATGAANQNLFVTGAEACFTARATFDEPGFRYRPGGTEGSPVTAEVSAQELCSAD
jgi:hypothetical protein